jgi:hypothetical protein
MHPCLLCLVSNPDAKVIISWIIRAVPVQTGQPSRRGHFSGGQTGGVTPVSIPIKSCRNQRPEDTQSEVRVEYGGGLKTEFNAFGAKFSLGGGGERQAREFTQVKTDIWVDRLPPKKQVIVAGTDNEGQTLYWELPHHNQATRAGQKEYAILAELAKAWTGDVGALICTAKQQGSLVASMGKANGLYLNGDNAAREKVEEGVRKARPILSGGDVDVLSTRSA